MRENTKIEEIVKLNPIDHGKYVEKLAKNVLRVRYELPDEFDFDAQAGSWTGEIKDVTAGILVGFDLNLAEVSRLTMALRMCAETPNAARGIAMSALGDTI